VSALQRLFRSTEDENRRVILETMPTRPGARLLDLGCGDGQWTIEVARHSGAGAVHAVEVMENAASAARARGIDVLVADLSSGLAPLEDASFDVIHSNQVIEHVRDTDCFLREIRRLLRPDGYALISTNNLSSWHNIVSLVLGWQPAPCQVSDRVNVGNPLDLSSGVEHGYWGPAHLRIFTGRALTELAEFHGLRAVVERSAGYYPLPPRLGRGLAQIDRRHAAFLVHRFEPDPDFTP
jgi:methionine biosynthesis protein MetW